MALMGIMSPLHAQPVHAQLIEIKSETLIEQIDRIEKAHNLTRKELYNLASSESILGTQRVGDNGNSCGVIHFHKEYYPYEHSRCDDDEYILNRAAEMIVAGEGYKFTPGNCYQFVKALLGDIPRMSDINPNTNIPRVGEIAIFYYNGKKHVGVEDEILSDGFWLKEANYEPYKIGRRFIKWNDPALAGFHSLGE